MFDAQFIATSMIGFIALACIIVRNSILPVDFAIEGVPHRRRRARRSAGLLQGPHPAHHDHRLRMDVWGASVILANPIFQGMAI